MGTPSDTSDPVTMGVDGLGVDGLGVDGLIVSSHLRWVRDELTDGALRAGLAVLTDWGLDLPDHTQFTRPAWWTPAGHGARLHQAGVPLRLAAPGPDWMAEVAAQLPDHTRRDVWAGTLDQLAIDPPWREGFVKLAEAKLDLDAHWAGDLPATARRLLDEGLPAGTRMQVAGRHLELCCEHRTWHQAHHTGQSRPVPVSVYAIHHQPGRRPGDSAEDGMVVWEPGMVDCPHGHAGAAASYATELAAELRVRGLLPPAVVLDVAHTSDGWALIEGNPVWCAGWYGTDPTDIIGALAAATLPDPTGSDARWRWVPDPALVQAAERRHPLRTPVYGKPAGALIRP